MALFCSGLGFGALPRHSYFWGRGVARPFLFPCLGRLAPAGLGFPLSRLVVVFAGVCEGFVDFSFWLKKNSFLRVLFFDGSGACLVPSVCYQSELVQKSREDAS